MVRQAIEDVVREMIGGGADGGCGRYDEIRPGNEDMLYTGGASATDGAGSGAAAGGSSDVGDTSDASSSLLNKCSQDDEKEKAKSKKAESGAGSWLVALARAMGEMTGNHLQKMMQAQDKMEASEVKEEELEGKSDKQKSEIKQEKGKEFTKAQAEFQAESKLFAMCSEATSTVLKSVGEGLSSMARKQ